ncbi:IclR family transcriptional regulator domain-containing protein [Leekyejoonella antrihumi]|uniref:IclR-ED domain-containing protein n=1 Tax=Leekyejoonella antrihumi TaxID=1660198 RepID=A0A563DXG1_9MICO|nr:hypothetical protein FGL98_15810 [Leekyejoonella antrihumi]
MDAVRRARYAIDYEEFRVRIGGVAAPVLGSGGVVVAALGVRGRSTRSLRPRVRSGPPC